MFNLMLCVLGFRLTLQLLGIPKCSGKKINLSSDVNVNVNAQVQGFGP